MKEKAKVFYGWYVVAAGCLIIGMTAGIIQNSFGQYIKPVCADMGFTRQQMSTNQTIVSIASMIFALMWGKLSKKIHLHKCMSVVAVLLPALYFCFSFITNLASFYLVTVLMMVVVVLWERRRKKAAKETHPAQRLSR
jgi:predicted MFS family arabinose efflux permease